MKKWLCVICGLIYDEAEGWPDDGIAPGTRWEDVPEDWTCPDCGVGKEDFEMIEMSGSDQAAAPVATPLTPAPAELPLAAVSTAANAATATTGKTAPIVIIGSGYAGYGLAEGLRKLSATVPVVLFTADDGANYSKPGLSNAMARGKTAAELVSQTAAQMADKLAITVHTTTPVSALDLQRKQVVHAGGTQAYSKLVLATGARPIQLPLQGDAAAEVLSVNSLSDYRVLRERLAAAAGKRVVVIGNGLVGCEYANELAVQGYQVTVVGLTQWPLDPVMPEAIGRELQNRLSALGVQWHLGNSVSTVSRQGAAYQLALAQGETLEADLVLSAVGLRPETSLAATAGLVCQRGIVVDASLQTSAMDVFALGDCTEINGQVLPYIAPITAGLRALPATLLGNSQSVDYPLMPVVVKTPALPLLLMPVKPGQTGAWQVEAVTDGLRGICRDAAGKVIGFALADKAQTERQQWLDAMRAG